MTKQKTEQNSKINVSQQDNVAPKPVDSAPEKETSKVQEDGGNSSADAILGKQEQALDDELAILKKENATLQEDLLRAKAETQNTIKRMQSESVTNYQRGMATVLENMMTIADDLERALNVKTDNHQALLDGVSMTLNQFTNVLAKQGLITINPAGGEKFDPNLHMAISEEETDEFEPKCVVRTVMKGYSLQARVLRPASVVVSIATPSKNIDTGEK